MTLVGLLCSCLPPTLERRAVINDLDGRVPNSSFKAPETPLGIGQRAPDNRSVVRIFHRPFPFSQKAVGRFGAVEPTAKLAVNRPPPESADVKNSRDRRLGLTASCGCGGLRGQIPCPQRTRVRAIDVASVRSRPDRREKLSAGSGPDRRTRRRCPSPAREAQARSSRAPLRHAFGHPRSCAYPLNRRQMSSR